MAGQQIPKEVAAAIEQCCPNGLIEEFDRRESYFYGIEDKLERDLRKISDASLIWQKAAHGDQPRWNEDDDDDSDVLPDTPEFRSYAVFFLVPEGDAFRYKTKTERYAPEDQLVLMEDELEPLESRTVTVAGDGWYGCTVLISLTCPGAAVTVGSYTGFEDGSVIDPQLERVCLDLLDDVAPVESYRKKLGAAAYAKLEGLRQKIAGVLRRHGIMVLNDSVLEMILPDIAPDEEVYLQKPVRLWHAFFFHGM